MKYEIPFGEIIEIKTIVLDLNGTLSVNGDIPSGVKERLSKLKGLGCKVVLLTGDQRGTAKELCDGLGLEYMLAQTGEEKGALMKHFDVDTCAAIGNGRIDIGTFRHAKVSVLTLQAEGIHVGAIKYADIIVPSICDALDLFIHKESLCATMRE